MKCCLRILVCVLLVSDVATGLTVESLKISGKISDCQMNQIADADVMLFEISGDNMFEPLMYTPHGKKKTDAEGNFHFDATVGTHHDVYVIARKEGLALGFTCINRRFPVLNDVTRTLEGYWVDMVLEGPHAIRGKVVDHEGKRVAGANIQFFSDVTGQREISKPEAWLATKSDGAGQFVLNNLPMDLRVRCYVQPPNSDIAYLFPLKEGRGNAAGAYYVGEQADLRLPPSTTVYGKVVDKHTNQGVPNICLMLSTDIGINTDYRFRSLAFHSQADGSFAVKGVPPGEHVFSVISSNTGKSEYAGRNVVINVADAEKAINTRITVEKSHPLVVRVIDAHTRATLPNVRVFVSDIAHPGQRDIFSKLATTDRHGLARFTVPLGQYTINAMSETHHNGFDENTGTKVNILSIPTAAMDIPIAMRLPPVRGIVYDPNGNPVRGARVNIGLGEKVITDGNGAFQGNQSPLYPAHLVTVYDKGGYLSGARSFYHASQALKIRLKPGCTIQGYARDRKGSGIAGANVRLDLNSVLRGGRRTIHGQAEMMTIRTDPNGCYQFDGVFPLRTGFHYRVSVDAVGYGTETFTIDQKMKSGEVVTSKDLIMLVTDASISGIVVDSQGHPVPNAHVHAGQVMGIGSHKGTTTDERGRFQINRIVAGPVSLWVDHRPSKEKATVDAHTGDHVTIRLGENRAYLSPLSLVGQPLPELSSLEMGYHAPRTKSKYTLVCFVDHTERKSMDVIRFLKKQSPRLRQNGVEIVCVLVNSMTDRDLHDWRKENRISFPVYVLPERYFDGYETQPLLHKTRPDYANYLMEKWGVRSIPWTILCDENQKISATGFHIARVLTYTQPAMNLYSPGTLNRRR